MAQISTTHVGSLHRPPDVVEMVTARENGEEMPGTDEAVRDAVRDVVAEQVAAGIDLVNDGEQGKRTFVSYVVERLSGFAVDRVELPPLLDQLEFPDFVALVNQLEPRIAPSKLPACVGPVAVRDAGAVGRDIANLAAAAAAAGVPADRVFMTAVSPAYVAQTLPNLYYRTHEEYVGALADALRDEYRAIVEAGFILQVDAPEVTIGQGERLVHETLEDVRRDIAFSIEALNAAVAELSPERMRIHLCWANRESPHAFDIELRQIVDLVVRARPAGISLEGANPRHGHEWAVFEEFTLPDEKYLLPGVIDTTTNFVEHPELVAQRLRNYTRLLGEERVVASTDCGFGTHAGRNRVARSVAWAKLGSLVEGAARAST